MTRRHRGNGLASCLAPLLALLPLAVTPSLARPSPAGTVSRGRPHPAVVRVITEDGDGYSCGSGALVAVADRCGLILTNWHVIRDARRSIRVVFSDGFSSAATVLGANATWDLAALAVWCPPIDPIRLAARPPRPGDRLSIAGYGPGWYRAATGRCTQYVSPGRGEPFEMVELSVAARQGDSGGPILNSRGELAGVLFGSAVGTTTGSASSRVRWFLDQVTGDFDRFAPGRTMIACSPTDAGRTAIARNPSPPPRGSTAGEGRPSDSPETAGGLPTAAIPARPLSADPPPAPKRSAAADWESPVSAQRPRPSPALPGPARGAPAATGSGATGAREAPGRFQRLKDLLSLVGLIAVIFHGLRLLSSLQRE